MRRERAEEAARLLSRARGGEPVGMLPPSCRPQSDADAYQIQDAVTSELGEAIGAGKWVRLRRPRPRTALRSTQR